MKVESKKEYVVKLTFKCDDLTAPGLFVLENNLKYNKVEKDTYVYINDDKSLEILFGKVFNIVIIKFNELNDENIDKVINLLNSFNDIIKPKLCTYEIIDIVNYGDKYDKYFNLSKVHKIPNKLSKYDIRGFQSMTDVNIDGINIKFVINNRPNDSLSIFVGSNGYNLEYVRKVFNIYKKFIDEGMENIDWWY